MNCDRIARAYQAAEWAAFGSRLQHHREFFLPIAPESGRALVLGDGDGRFLAQLAAAKPHLQIDALEASARMNDLARKRLASMDPGIFENRICLRQANALTEPLGDAVYSAVFTHFFLDCFPAEDLASFVPRLSQAVCPGALWVISEFQLPRAGLKRWHALAWLHAMYAFFRAATELQTTRLPDYRPILQKAGWRPGARVTSMAELICSETWTYRGSRSS